MPRKTRNCCKLLCERTPKTKMAKTARFLPTSLNRYPILYVFVHLVLHAQHSSLMVKDHHTLTHSTLWYARRHTYWLHLHKSPEDSNQPGAWRLVPCAHPQTATLQEEASTAAPITIQVCQPWSLVCRCTCIHKGNSGISQPQDHVVWWLAGVLCARMLLVPQHNTGPICVYHVCTY